ncbi:MAG: 30S ribosomal protein S20 [Pirellula sp.]
MPNIQSAKKRLRQSLVRRSRNRSAKSSIKTAVKRLQASVQAKEFDAARTQLQAINKLLDQTASKGVIHVNKASRTKSRLSQFVKKAALA